MNGTAWTPKQLALLRRIYANAPTRDVAKACAHSVASVYHYAFKFGLQKSAEFLAKPESGRMLKGTTRGARFRFPKGHVPANKGLRRPGWGTAAMRATWFKKGQFPVGKDPEFYVIGALRVNCDGYIEMRVSFDKGALGWRGLHRILWEDAHGPIPKGHIITFRDRDSLNCELNNLEMITLADNCRRNSIHNLPQPLRKSIQLLGALKRTIKRRTRDEDHRGSAHASVRNARCTQGQRPSDGTGPRKSGGGRGAGDRRLGARGSRNVPSYRRPRRQRLLAAART